MSGEPTRGRVDAEGVGGLPERIAEQIREAIHDGAYAPGQRLVERRLGHELGVSHIPVREALARLGDEGLVERLPRRGARVTKLTARSLAEISSLRIVLEQFVVRRVQERLTAAHEAELRGLVAQMLERADAGDVEAVIAWDGRFHARLWELAEHGLLNDLAAGVRSRIAAFLRAATRDLAQPALCTHARTHVVLLDAIASGDPEAAEAEMGRHISVAAERVAEGLAEPRAAV